MMNDWSRFSLTELRGFARTYNKDIKIAGAAKLKKEDLITELDKHLKVEYDSQGGHSVSLKIKSQTYETKKQGEVKKLKKDAKVTAYMVEPAKVERVVMGKERKPRADKGAKHTYPEGRKERNDKGKKRKPMAPAAAGY